LKAASKKQKTFLFHNSNKNKMLNDFQTQKFDYLYHIFDKNKNGKVEEQDFHAAFAGMPHQEKAQKAARRWWLVLKIFGDKNKDTALSKEEWFKWATVVADKLQTQEDAPMYYQRWGNAIFDSIDSEEKGAISLEEYQTWFDSFGLAGDSTQVFQGLDHNGDGLISKDEFRQLTYEFAKADANAAGNSLFGNPA